ESARERAHSDQDRRCVYVFGTLNRNGNDVVLLQNFDGSFGPPLALRHTQNRVPPLASRAYFRDPVVDTATEFEGRLATDVSNAAGVRDPGSGIRGGFFDRELSEMCAGDQPRLEICPCHVGLHW